jgi:flagellar basal-body rod protein FlgF
LISGMYKLIDGSLVQKLRFDTISNNLANINTNAFKKDTVSFREALSMQNSANIDLSPGPLRYTGNELDMALETPGFFRVQTPRGIRYTRDGSFTLNAERVLVTKHGYPVLGENGPILINGSSVTVESDGTVVAANEPVDTLAVADFREPRLLRKEGSSYYAFEGEETDIVDPEVINVQNGYVERSNVDATVEMVKMVESLRVYESAQKAIQCIDEMNDKMVNQVGRLE